MVSDPFLGRQLANFRVERLIGRGGMARVYYGWDVKLQRPVAIKVIDARYQREPAYAQRFLREAQAVATWRHDNIVQVHYADDQDGLYYFVMEHIDGRDLATLLSKYAAAGELAPHPDVLRIGRAVANALDYAHRKGVIHRDVKPSNVMVARDGRVVLGDFGLAMDVQQGSLGEVVGTPHYVAPEQARRSADAVPQSDLYSLGVVLYEMLTGSVPFDDPSPTSLALQHLTQPPPLPRELNPELNAETEAVLLKSLSKSPHDRYQTGAELIEALEKALQAEPSLREPIALPPPPAALHGPPARRLSRVTLAEKVALNLQKLPSAKPDVVHWPRLTQPRRFPVALLAGIGGGLTLGAIAVAIGAWVIANPNPGGQETLIAVIPSTTQEPTVEPAAAPTTLLPIETRAPTEPVTSAATLRPAATHTARPTLTLTPSEAATMETPLPQPSPTVLYPGGRRFTLFYNDNSFYLLNASGKDSAVAPLAFERLDANGNATSRFDGWRWAQFYPTINPGRCMSLEILESQPYLRPSQCNNLYNSVRTPARDENYIFWTTQESSRQFRVLWSDQEVARCEIAASACEFFLP